MGFLDLFCGMVDTSADGPAVNNRPANSNKGVKKSKDDWEELRFVRHKNQEGKLVEVVRRGSKKEGDGQDNVQGTTQTKDKKSSRKSGSSEKRTHELTRKALRDLERQHSHESDLQSRQQHNASSRAGNSGAYMAPGTLRQPGRGSSRYGTASGSGSVEPGRYQGRAAHRDTATYTTYSGMGPLHRVHHESELATPSVAPSRTHTGLPLPRREGLGRRESSRRSIVSYIEDTNRYHWRSHYAGPDATLSSRDHHSGRRGSERSPLSPATTSTTTATRPPATSSSSTGPSRPHHGGSRNSGPNRRSGTNSGSSERPRGPRPQQPRRGVPGTTPAPPVYNSVGIQAQRSLVSSKDPLQNALIPPRRRLTREQRIARSGTSSTGGHAAPPSSPVNME